MLNRYFDNKGNYFFDFDYPHGNVKDSHWHGLPGGMMKNRTKGHWNYLRFVWWLITGK